MEAAFPLHDYEKLFGPPVKVTVIAQIDCFSDADISYRFTARVSIQFPDLRDHLVGLQLCPKLPKLTPRPKHYCRCIKRASNGRLQ